MVCQPLSTCLPHSKCSVAVVNSFVINISKTASGSDFPVLQPTIPQTPGKPVLGWDFILILVLQAAGPDLGQGWELGGAEEEGCLKSMP